MDSRQQFDLQKQFLSKLFSLQDIFKQIKFFHDRTTEIF